MNSTVGSSTVSVGGSLAGVIMILMVEGGELMWVSSLSYMSISMIRTMLDGFFSSLLYRTAFNASSNTSGYNSVVLSLETRMKLNWSPTIETLGGNIAGSASTCSSELGLTRRTWALLNLQ